VTLVGGVDDGHTIMDACEISDILDALPDEDDANGSSSLPAKMADEDEGSVVAAAATAGANGGTIGIGTDDDNEEATNGCAIVTPPIIGAPEADMRVGGSVEGCACVAAATARGKGTADAGGSCNGGNGALDGSSVGDTAGVMIGV
jgi:hypothetical protein